MPSTSSSSSSDEDDERIKQLREAAVSFETISKASEKTKSARKDERANAKPSNRPDRRGEDKEDGDDLNVTPEFQDFVARKLMKSLDEMIEYVDVPKRKVKAKSSGSSGFLLLRNHVLDVDAPPQETTKTTTKKATASAAEKKNNKKKKRKKSKSNDSSSSSSSSSDDEDDDNQKEMLKEAAVNVDQILKSRSYEAAPKPARVVEHLSG